MRLVTVILTAVLAACGGEVPVPQPPARPERIVSLDHCADQFALTFAPREHVLAVSPGAARDFSAVREAARGVPTVPPDIEDVLLLEPDLVVRAYGGGADAAAALRRAGIPVIEIGWSATLDDAADTVARVGTALGDGAKAARLAARLRSLTDSAVPEGSRGRLLYLTPSGVTTGPGSLIDRVIRSAGYENFETRPGWHDVALERLVEERPDRIVTAFFDAEARFRGHWSVGRHPLLAEMLASVPRTHVPGAWLSCSTWTLADVARRIGAEGV